MSEFISPGALKEMLLDNDELALIDVREGAVFGRAHLLHACSLPLSRLELHIADLVPRRSVRVVVCDGGEGLAERAAKRLRYFGYSDVRLLEGGIKTWADAGYEVFSGVNVPSKAFGEFIEHEYSTPSISAEELKAKLDVGEDLVILDSRPMDEYRVMNIPGAVCVPGAELVYRARDIAPSSDTLVVVNCAGRTRSIIGAQSLINASIPNRVVALRNGTMGWHLSGYELEHGMERKAPEVSAKGLASARAAAAQVGHRFGVTTIDRTTLGRWIEEREQRSLHLLDVRSPGEYEAGHLPASISAPGGQLVQATDRYVGTLRSRIVLIDDTGVRATMTASWLKQMGWMEVVVLENALETEGLEEGARRAPVLGVDEVDVDEISPQALMQLSAGGVNVVDLSDSSSYRLRHIPQAWFALRSRLSDALTKLPSAALLILTSEDGVLAHFAAAEVAALTSTPVKVLAGGNAAWAADGLPLAEGFENMASEADDVWLRPYDRESGAEDAMQDYLSWEVDLVHQIERDGTTGFRGANTL
ncbi:MAG: rhodanese-like domain-containing protein [Acidiferrobacterales bacterium]